MEFDKFFSKYWCKIDSKILLANYAQQKKLGIISKKISNDFENHLSRCTLSTPSALEILNYKSSPSSFVLEEAIFCSSIYPTLGTDQVIIRVAPLGIILSKVDMGGQETRLQKQLENFMDTSNDDVFRNKSELRLRNAFAKGVFSDFEFDWPDVIEPFTAFSLEAKLKRESGAGLAEIKSSQPRFISYLTDEFGYQNVDLAELKGDLTTIRGYNVSDFARDIFGLDHLADSYCGKPNVLGFVAFRVSELDDYQCKRPSVFDDTSALRFKGACSKDSPSIKVWGHTVDLFKINDSYEKGSGECIIGCPEAVINNPKLVGERQVLIGYLGPLGVPREDHNDLEPSTKPNQHAKMQELHSLFLQECLFGMSPCDVHAAIFGGS